MYPAPPPFCDQNKRKPRSQAQCTPCDDMSSQPAARCAVCGHQETNHAVERGQRGACGVLRCRCRQWTPPSPLPRPSYSGPRERNRRVKSARSAPVLAQVDLTRRCSDATSAGRSGGAVSALTRTDGACARWRYWKPGRAVRGASTNDGHPQFHVSQPASASCSIRTWRQRQQRYGVHGVRRLRGNHGVGGISRAGSCSAIR